MNREKTLLMIALCGGVVGVLVFLMTLLQGVPSVDFPRVEKKFQFTEFHLENEERPMSETRELAVRFLPLRKQAPTIQVRDIKREAQPATWLSLIGGYVDGDGVRWLFVKDSRKQQVFKLRDDGLECEYGRLLETSKEYYIARIEGFNYQINRN